MFSKTHLFLNNLYLQCSAVGTSALTTEVKMARKWSSSLTFKSYLG